MVNQENDLQYKKPKQVANLHTEHEEEVTPERKLKKLKSLKRGSSSQSRKCGSQSRRSTRSDTKKDNRKMKQVELEYNESEYCERSEDE